MNSLRGLLKWVAIASLAFALVLGGSRIAHTFAQSPTPEAEQADPPASDPSASNPERGWNMERFSAMRRGGGPFGGKDNARPGKQGLALVLVDETAQQTNQDVSAVLDQLRDGQSLSAIAAASSVADQTIIDAALQRVDAQLSTAVTNGRIDEAQKTTMLEKATAQAPELMQQTDFAGVGGPRDHAMHGEPLLIEATAEVTGLTRAEVRTELKAGNSLAQIAEAHGKTADDILANLRTKGEAKLQELLDRAATQIDKVPGK